MKAFSRILLLGLSIWMVVSLAGCPFSTKNEPDNGGDPPLIFLPRTSPQNLMKNLKAAYEQRDITEFDSLLDPVFTFFFSEEDQNIGERLNRDEEIGIHRGMFDSDMVQDLNLSFDMGAVTLDEERTTVDDSLYVMTLTNVDLYLYGKTPQFPLEDPRGYEMENGQERFWFHKRDYTHPVTKEPIWTIVEWLEL
jgi:hypothetical protein